MKSYVVFVVVVLLIIVGTIAIGYLYSTTYYRTVSYSTPLTSTFIMGDGDKIPLRKISVTVTSKGRGEGSGRISTTTLRNKLHEFVGKYRSTTFSSSLSMFDEIVIGEKRINLGQNPTLDTLARYLFKEFSKEQIAGGYIVAVSVKDTHGTKGEYSRVHPYNYS